MSRWVAALRIARRTVLRSPSRSLLIAILVGLPVAGATYADLIARSFNSTEREALRIVGASDGAVTVTGLASMPGGYDPRWLVSPHSVPAGTRHDVSRAEIAALLPSGTRLLPMTLQRQVTLQERERIVRTTMLIGDVRERLYRHVMRLEDSTPAPGPDDVLVTRRLAERLRLLDDGHLRAEATITPMGDPASRVAGLVVDPTCLSCEQIVAAPSAPIVAATRRPRAHDTNLAYGTTDPTYLVDLPDGTDDRVLGSTLAAHGLALTTRDGLLHPPPSGGRFDIADPDTQRAAALVAIIVALGLLEVVLLAGTAFAVGARRQLRELGLVAAGGGSPGDVRRIVLAQGLVLGAIGAVIGIAIGAGIALAGRSVWERYADFEIAGWHFGPLEIAGAGLVGLFSGLAAAFVPAVGAGRMRPVNALAGRFRVAVASRRRNTVIGLGLVAAGIVLGLVGAHQLAGDFAAYDRALAEVKRTGRFLQTPGSDGSTTLVIVSATLAIIGLVLLAPALIGWIARIGGRLPLSARLAVRDAERQRHRTGPATSAIVIAVTGSVLLASLLAARFHADDLRYVPALPPHTISVMRGDTSTSAMLLAGRRAAELLPGGRSLTVNSAAELPRRGAHREPEEPVEVVSLAPSEQDPCRPGGGCNFYVQPRSGGVAIGGDDAVTRLIAGPGYDDAARRALADGKLLVFDTSQRDASGRATVATRDGEVQLAAHVVRTDRAYAKLPAALISADAARVHGWRPAADSVLVSFAPAATRDDVDAAMTRVTETGAFAAYDDGLDQHRNLVLLLIAAASALVTLIGVAISIALSAAEGRADVATLAVVGAPAGRRRALLACQALLVGGLGCLLGVALGMFIAYIARATTGSPDFVVPWANLAATGLGVPLLAALVAAASTRGRLPLVRRAD